MRPGGKIHLVFSRRQLAGFLTLALMASGAYLMSESFTLSTSYPAPSGIYNKMITTGATFLVRDQGNLGVGTTNPGEKLEINGNIRLAGGTTTYRIVNVGDPVNNTDVATKAYVDAATPAAGKFYIVVNKAYVSGYCNERHAGWCPTGWTIESTWFSNAAQGSCMIYNPYPQWSNDYSEWASLCSK